MIINGISVPFMIIIPNNLGDGTAGTTPIHVGDEIVATDPNDKMITFINGGSIITSVTDIINYFNNYYPIGTILTTNIYQKIQQVMSLLGGNAPGLMNRMSSFSRTVLDNPTGNVTNDLITIRNKLGISGTFEAAITGLINKIKSNTSDINQGVEDVLYLTGGSEINTQIVNFHTRIGGSSNIEDNIGIPTVGGTSGSLFSMIGGTENNLSSIIGDISAGGTTGLAGKFDKNSLSLPNGIFDSNTTSSFTYGNDINTAMTNFLSLFDKSKFDRSSDTKIVIDCSGGPPASFSELLSRITTTT